MSFVEALYTNFKHFSIKLQLANFPAVLVSKPLKASLRSTKPIVLISWVEFKVAQLSPICLFGTAVPCVQLIYNYELSI